MSAPPIKPSDAPTPELNLNEQQMSRIRITLTSRTVDILEQACADLKKKAGDMQVKVKGPVRMPTKILRLTVRKAPCGEGTNTWDRFQMRIHKRILDLKCPLGVLNQITKSFRLAAGVDVELTISDK